MSKVAFVTGGTGFIGSHLVEELHRRGYTEVRCLVRDRLKWLEGLECTPVRGNLTQVEVLWKAVDNVDYVYHVAGVTRARDWESFEQGNVLSTLNLLGALRLANPEIRKILITSSLAAVGRCPDGVATESTPLDPISRYGKSKAAMEKAIATPLADGSCYIDSLPIVIIRPPAVYGPRESDIYTLFKTAKKGLFPILGSGRRPDVSLIHVYDLVRGMVDAAETEVTSGETFFLGSERFYSWSEVKTHLMSALGRKALTIPVPLMLVGAVGTVSEIVGKLAGTYPPLNKEKALEIRDACKMCSVEKAKQTFGFRQMVPLEMGLVETVEWYRKKGWL